MQSKDTQKQSFLKTLNAKTMDTHENPRFDVNKRFLEGS